MIFDERGGSLATAKLHYRNLYTWYIFYVYDREDGPPKNLLYNCTGRVLGWKVRQSASGTANIECDANVNAQADGRPA
jgi:hypothetical protein